MSISSSSSSQVAQDTEQIQSLLSNRRQVVKIPARESPYVVGPLYLNGNKTLVLEPDTVIEGCLGYFEDDFNCLFQASDADNITIQASGATLRMNCAEIVREKQHRHILSFTGCRNVQIIGGTFEAAGGDGVYIGRTTKGCSDIALRNCICQGNGRQGVSVISCNRLLVDGCVLSGTVGNFPGAGIDFEPNSPDEVLIGCVVQNTEIRDNSVRGLLMNLAHLDGYSLPIQVTVRNCIIDTTAADGYAIQILAEASNPSGTLSLRNNVVRGRSRFYISDDIQLNIS